VAASNGTDSGLLILCRASSAGFLRIGFATLKSHKLDGRRQFGSIAQNRIEEIKQQGSENWIVPAYEDEHLSRRHDLFRVVFALLLWRLQSRHFVRRHEWPLNVVEACADMPHDGGESRPAEVVAGVRNSRNACHFAQEVRSFILVWGISDADVAVGNDALVVAVCIDNLPDVPRDQEEHAPHIVAGE